MVAIKKVTNVFRDLVDAKRILREIKLMQHFDHENVRRAPERGALLAATAAGAARG